MIISLLGLSVFYFYSINNFSLDQKSKDFINIKNDNKLSSKFNHSPATGKDPSIIGESIEKYLGDEATKTVGLILNSSKAFDGYTLFTPMHHTVTYLIDNNGKVVNYWKSNYKPGLTAYLLENGNLLRACFAGRSREEGGGGRIEEYDWDGNLIWEFDFNSDQYLLHHDFEPLPNGNVLAIAYEEKSNEEAMAAGFTPDMLTRQMFPDFIIEIEKNGKKGGNIVWEWHAWDHLVQDVSPGKLNYGDPFVHPELIDISSRSWEVRDKLLKDFGLEKTATPGIDNGRRKGAASWNHLNSIDYNPRLDRILVSSRGHNEIWIIDHSTTIEEAASHSGGKYGRGGDLLYRWGNPVAYKRGSESDQKFFQQHDAQWIKDGSPGAGNIIIFNNGTTRGHSSIDEIKPPIDSEGNYVISSNKPFGPINQTWIYKAKESKDFFSKAISGTQRLPNGNTLIVEGSNGTFFEVTPDKEIVWKYICPVDNIGPMHQGEVAANAARENMYNSVFKIRKYAPDYPGLSSL